jgi:hypothetical protein
MSKLFKVTYTVLVEIDEEDATVDGAADEVSCALSEIGQGIGETSRLVTAALVNAEEVAQ